MADQKLRSDLIRLAHANPELRKDLLPLLKLGGRDDRWFKDENFRRERYYEVRDNVLKDISVLKRRNAKVLKLYKRAYESALSLHSETTNHQIKDHLENTVLKDGLRYAYEAGYKKDKELLEQSVASITQMIEAAFNLGAMAGFVPDKYVGQRNFPLHPEVRESLDFHRKESVKKWY